MPAYLVIQAARFGDLVQTKRLLLTLAARGRVLLAVDRGLVPLARQVYPFAEICPLAVHGMPVAESLAHNHALLSRWRHLGVDAVFNCNFSPLTQALCRVFPPETVHGYRPEGGGLSRSPWAGLGFRLSRRRAGTPLNLVDFWAHFACAPVAPAAVNPPARPGGRGLGVALAGRAARRSLPVPVLAEAVRTAFGALGCKKAFLLGTAAEQPVARRLLRHLPPGMLEAVEDLSGKTDWPALVQAVAGLDALITPDTGIMHLAAHLGVPVLAFFLSSAWLHETGPYGVGHHVWQASPSCAPCLETAPCPHDVACARPLADAALARSLRAVCLGLARGDDGRAAPPLPEGLQLWRTDVDALGASPRLLSGQDAQAEMRMAARQFLAARRGVALPLCAGMRPSPAVGEWLCDDADWMLPPGRYS